MMAIALLLTAALAAAPPAPTLVGIATLEGTAWRLVKFQGGDDRVLVAADREQYTLDFAAGGKVSVRIACNRGHGTWKSEGPNGLVFGPLALTRAMCPDDPLQDRLTKDWAYVRSYVIKDGRLFLSLMADGGIYEFEPQNPVAAGPKAATGSGPVAGPLLPASGTIAAGQFQLRYRIEGKGMPAIVIGSAIYYPRIFSQNLREHLRMVFLDHRGFAASPGPVDRSEFALDKLLDDIERARQELGLGRIAIIGHSGHAFMALEYAKKFPASVSHVIMIGISPSLSAASAESAERHWQESVSPDRKAVMEENLRRFPDEALAQLPAGERFIKSYLRSAPRAWYDPRFDAAPLWEGVEMNLDMFGYVWGEVFRDIDITQGLTTFDRPVFLALGRYDFVVAPPSSWDDLRPKFRDLTVRVFERSGHTPPYEEAPLFEAELLRWMKERG